MDDLNACAECGFTTKNFDEFTLHIQRHEEDVADTNLAINLTMTSSEKNDAEVSKIIVQVYIF